MFLLSCPVSVSVPVSDSLRLFLSFTSFDIFFLFLLFLLAYLFSSFGFSPFIIFNHLSRPCLPLPFLKLPLTTLPCHFAAELITLFFSSSLFPPLSDAIISRLTLMHFINYSLPRHSIYTNNLYLFCFLSLSLITSSMAIK